MRYDKVDPRDGSFRAPLAAAHVKTSGAVGSGATAALAYGLDNQGRAVPGDANTGVKALACFTSDMVAGQAADFMTDGEVVEFGGVAGTNYVADNATGVIAAGEPDDTHTYIGHTVEANRLIVRVGRYTPAPAAGP